MNDSLFFESSNRTASLCMIQQGLDNGMRNIPTDSSQLTCSALVGCMTNGNNSSIPPETALVLAPTVGPREPGVDVADAIVLLDVQKRKTINRLSGHNVMQIDVMDQVD